MSLCTGVEIIFIFMIFNKMSGFYGLLAVLTGLHLSHLQLSMYIYSCIAIIILACLMPHIRRKSPFQCMLLSYFYLLDTIINTLFTSVFAINWFLAVSDGNRIPDTVPGSKTIMKTAGFTNHKYNSNVVEIMVNPSSNIKSSRDSILCAVASASGSGSILEETIPSVALVVGLTIIRLYFVLIVLAYARQVIQGVSFQTDSSKLHVHTDGCADTLPGKNPFGADSPEGMGWKGKIGRKMIQIGEGYWLGEDKKNNAWLKGLDGRFRSSKIETELPGTIERERRARSGTGPPTPLLNT